LGVQLAKDHERITLPPGIRIIDDAFQTIEAPGRIGAIPVNMDHAEALRTRLAQKGVHVGFIHMLVKATALAACRVPEARSFLQGYTIRILQAGEDRLEAFEVRFRDPETGRRIILKGEGFHLRPLEVALRAQEGKSP
jgi:hypothetical protein